MDIKKLIQFLQSLGLPAKVISVIIITLISILVIFFGSGCSYKFHADKIDNVTREIYISK